MECISITLPDFRYTPRKKNVEESMSTDGGFISSFTEDFNII